MQDPIDASGLADGDVNAIEALDGYERHDATRIAPEARPSHVVGVGASAGGLEALEQLFDKLPPDTGMAFVVVQHLSPDFKSMMDELLSRHTRMPIHRVEDGLRVEPNSVYLIPPKKEMIISDGRLLLTDKDPSQNLSLPINVFLRSLARDLGKRAMAIVLSGSGSDGAIGVKAIHDAGGLVLVQDEESARFDGMPRSATAAGVADIITHPAAMPRALLRLVDVTSTAGPGEPRGPRSDDDDLAEIYERMRKACGIDFTFYTSHGQALRFPGAGRS